MARPWLGIHPLLWTLVNPCLQLGWPTSNSRISVWAPVCDSWEFLLREQLNSAWHTPTSWHVTSYTFTLHLQQAQGSVVRTSQACGAHVGTNTGYFTCYISLLHRDEWSSGGYPFTGTVKTGVASGACGITDAIMRKTPKCQKIREVLNPNTSLGLWEAQVWFLVKESFGFVVTSKTP